MPPRFSATEIETAIERNQLLFHFQPKVNFATGEISGAEALVRWQRDDGTVVPPDAFVPVAEQEGLISRLTQAIFPQLVRDIHAIREKAPGLAIAFNISAHDLEGPGLGNLIREAAGDGAMDIKALELELTESAVVSGNESTNSGILSLIEGGVRFSMDDYGTGFSSLRTLKDLPFSTIKIDQSFVLSMMRSPKSATLVKASVATAQMLGIKTVIEGIESEAVYNSLMHSGCNEAQGFWISEPLALDEFLAFLDTGKTWPASPVGMLRMAQLSHTWQHKLLMDQVFAFLRSRDRHEVRLDGLHLDVHNCTLGKWCSHQGRDLVGDADFDRLQSPHVRMHDICEDIFSALDHKAPTTQVMTLLNDLTEAACLVNSCLQRLETRLLTRELRDGE